MITTRTRVEVPGAAYDVVVGEGLLAQAPKLISEVSDARVVAVITDDAVAPRYAMQLDTALARAGLQVTPIAVPAGETSKSWQVAGQVLEALAEKHLDRSGLIVALGGGVVGDLAGFTAAVFLRGVEFVQIPTTLLAMVDSSVGGKTGVDLRAGKNLAGAFKQPLLVIADMSVLATLPEAQWQSGLAELAKSAVLSGEDFTAWVETNAAALVAREPQAVGDAVVRCVKFKSAVVSRDEREKGPRECLNYGHTLGHALEKVLGYGSLTHGAAVAEGMRFAARLSMEAAGADSEFVKRQDRVLDALGLGALPVRAEPRVLLDAMHGDKKARGGVVRAVLVDGPGAWHCDAVDDRVMLEHLDAWAAAKGGE